MILALSGPSVDGSFYRDVVHAAHDTPGPLDTLVTAWSTYGLALFGVLAAVGWWRARRSADPAAAVTALAVPVVVLAAFGVNSLLKLLVREQRPCQEMRLAYRTLETCPARGDWSFPSNHTAIAFAAAVALCFVSRRLGRVAVPAACAMGASRVWVGVHYPHDVVVGAVVGGLVAYALMTALRRPGPALAARLSATRLRPLLTGARAEPAAERVRTPAG